CSLGPPEPRMPISTATTRLGRESLLWSCELTLLTRPLDVDDAARAKFRMPRIAADIAAQMPTSHAFGLRTGFDLDPHAGFAGRYRRGGRRVGLNHPRLAGNQQKSQFVAQRLVPRGLS